MNKTLIPHKSRIDQLLSRGKKPSEVAKEIKEVVGLETDSIRRYLQDYIKEGARRKEVPTEELVWGDTGDTRSAKEILREMKAVNPFKPVLKKGKYQTWIICNCVHRPFHSKPLWKALLNLIYDLRPTLGGIIWNGDYLDLVSLSTHSPGSIAFEGWDLGKEYEDGLNGLMDVEQAVGNKKIERAYLFGNHEERWCRTIVKLDNSKFGKALVSPIEGLRLEELKYNVQADYKDGFIELGEGLQVHHGIYYGISAAKKHLDMMPGKSCIFGHTHRRQSHTGPNGHTAWNTGCLIDLNHNVFKYANRFQKAQWQNGFAVVHVTDNGDTVVNSIECINDRFFFGGKMY